VSSLPFCFHLTNLRSFHQFVGLVLYRLASQDCNGVYMRITHTDGVAGAESADVYIAGVCDPDTQVSRSQVTGVTTWNLALTDDDDILDLNGIQSPVFIAAGNGYDVLNINASDPSGTQGTCIAYQCTGLGTSGSGIQWSAALEKVNVIGGTGDDLFTIGGIAPNSFLSIDGGAGNDEYTIAGTINGLASFGSNSAILVNDSSRDGINTLDIDMSISTLSGSLTLTQSSVSGYGLPSSYINYYGINIINAVQGCANGLPSGCTAATVIQSSLPNVTVEVDVNNSPANQVFIGVPGTGLDTIRGTVTIDGALKPGACTASVFVVHSGATSVVTSGKLTNSDITGIGSCSVRYNQICTLDIQLGSSADVFDINVTHMYTTYVRTGAGNDDISIGAINGITTVYAESGDDHIALGTQTVPAVNRILQLVTLDGGTGSDTYDLSWSGDGSSAIFVDDSSIHGEDYDILNAIGTSAADEILFRIGVMAMMNANPDITQTTKLAEEIRYTDVISEVNVDSEDGDDMLVFDDVVSRQMGVSGGNGSDVFIVGQLYNAPHDSYGVGTVLTTRGYLSHGTTSPLSLFGGNDNDKFLLQHNLGVMFVFGEAGDDIVVLRSFLILNVTEESTCSRQQALNFTSPSNSTVVRLNITISGGEGNDQLQFDMSPEYVQNAPVQADGGSGFNSFALVGTEAADAFVVAEDELCGGGRYAEYVNFQEFVVLGAEGNDRIYVLGSPQGAVLRISGGLGSDSVQIATGWIGEPVACNPLRGHSGLINHTTTSNDINWNNTLVDGLVAHVHDPSDLIFIMTSKAHIWASSNIAAFPSSFTTSFQLTARPMDEVDIVIDVASRGFEASVSLVVNPEHFTFTPQDWFSPRTFTVTAHSVPDSDINYKTNVLFTAYSTDSRFYEQPLPMLTLEVSDAQRSPIMYRAATNGFGSPVLLEHDMTSPIQLPAVWSSTAQIIVGINTGIGVTVPSSVEVTAVANDALVTLPPITLTAAHPTATVTLQAINDGLRNGARDTFLYFTSDAGTITSPYTMTLTSVNAQPPLEVHIEDDDTPNVMVLENTYGSINTSINWFNYS
jgi:aspartate 1-decarboxylase